ncbi:hypothetical protein Tco_0405806 [Tanacetum coccineum]
MNDEPMWAANRVVALTLGSAITIPEIANDFTIKGFELLQSAYFQLLSLWVAKLATFAVMYKAYGGKPSVGLLRAFLNLSPEDNWLTLSNRGDSNVPKSITKPVTHIEGWKEMDFKSFMMEGIDVEFHFFPRDDLKNEGWESPSIFVNNETPMTYDTLCEKDEVILVHRLVIGKAKNRKVSMSSKVAGKRKQAISASLGKETHSKTHMVPPQASKAAGKPSDPLDVYSDPDIYDRFPPSPIPFFWSGISVDTAYPRFPLWSLEQSIVVGVSPWQSVQVSYERNSNGWGGLCIASWDHDVFFKVSNQYHCDSSDSIRFFCQKTPVLLGVKSSHTNVSDEILKTFFRGRALVNMSTNCPASLTSAVIYKPYPLRNCIPLEVLMRVSRRTSMIGSEKSCVVQSQNTSDTKSPIVYVTS